MMGCLARGVGTLDRKGDVEERSGDFGGKRIIKITEHSQRCGYSLKLTRQVPRMKPCRQVLGTNSSRQAPSTKSPGPTPIWEQPRRKTSRKEHLSKSPRAKTLLIVPRTTPRPPNPMTK